MFQVATDASFGLENKDGACDLVTPPPFVDHIAAGVRPSLPYNLNAHS